MSKEYSYIDALKAHREVQHKFDYFFLGVILALLSLSIQMFNPESYPIAQFLIIIFWFLLVVSFLSGMYRQEKKDVFMQEEAKLISVQEQLEFLKKVKREEVLLYHSPGQPWTADEVKAEFQGFKRLEESRKERREKAIKYAIISYRIQKIAFVLALVLFIVFRVINIDPK